jgi:hypothetical protein
MYRVFTQKVKKTTVWAVGLDLDLRLLFFRLCYAFDMLIQEFEDGLVSLDFVLFLYKTMSLIIEYDVFHRDIVFFDRFYDFIGLDLEDPRVVGPLEDHQRLDDFFGMKEGRDAPQVF